MAADLAALDTAYAELGLEWGGRRSVAVRRRGAALAGAGGLLAGELGAVGAALQEHATDLAELAARAREIAERAARDGLQVRERRIELAYGVTGEAVAELADAREHHRTGLQAELDVVLIQLDRRRRRLLDLVTVSTAALAAVSAEVRLR
jgi:hypothetical protein